MLISTGEVLNILVLSAWKRRSTLNITAIKLLRCTSVQLHNYFENCQSAAWLPKNICKISSGKIFKLKASCADRSGRGGAGRAVSGLTDNLAAKQSPAVSCGDQRAVHFTPHNFHITPNMCLCVQETHPDIVTSHPSHLCTSK